MKINDKVAIITGAASGLGLATAQHLQQCGAHIAVFDFNQERLQQVQQQFGFEVFHVDVSQADSAAQAVDAVVEKLGDVHININCAGVAPGARIVGKAGAQDLQHFERVIAVNLIGTFNVMRLVAAQLYKQELLNDTGERGVIINTASVAAFEGQIGQAAYSASKGGVAAMTLPAAREFAKFGIRVMTIAPGIMHTPMMGGMSQEVQDSLHASVPFPARMGQPAEYAKLAAHIIENTYLNGEVIRLDGAIRMQPK